MNISISNIKKQALTSLKGQWGTALLLTFIMFLVTLLLPSFVEILFSGGFANWWMNEELPISATIASTVISILLIPFSTAVYWVFLALYRVEGPKISELFTVYAEGKTALKVVGASFLVAIFTILWSLLLIVPGIIKGLAYSQTYFIIKDHPEYTALQAITESKERMKGYKWKYFLLNLSFIGWGILTIFTLGIGLLWLVPYISTANAAFYNEFIAKKA